VWIPGNIPSPRLLLPPGHGRVRERFVNNQQICVDFTSLSTCIIRISSLTPHQDYLSPASWNRARFAFIKGSHRTHTTRAIATWPTRLISVASQAVNKSETTFLTVQTLHLQPRRSVPLRCHSVPPTSSLALDLLYHHHPPSLFAKGPAPTRSCPPCPRTGGTRAKSSSRCGALTSNRSTRWVSRLHAARARVRPSACPSLREYPTVWLTSDAWLKRSKSNDKVDGGHTGRAL